MRKQSVIENLLMSEISRPNQNDYLYHVRRSINKDMQHIVKKLVI